MILPTAILTLLIGGVCVALGLRGRRTDDHPLCRRCRYDLTGRSADTARCGECGAELSRPGAIRVGHRARRRGLLWAGVLVGLPSIAVLMTGGWVQARHVDLTPYMPVWWLQNDLNAGPSAQAAALAELTARVTAGHLSPSQVVAVADRALADQASAAPWAPAWGAFLEAAHAAGRLDRPRWATYARQAFALALHARPSIRPGDPIPLSIDCSTNHVTGAGFAALFDLNDLRVDDHSVGGPLSRWNTGFAGHRGRLSVGVVNSGATYYSPRVDAAATGQLALGPHAVGGTLHLLVFEDADLTRYNGGTGNPPPDPAKQLAVIDVPVSAPVTVVDPAHEPPLTVVDPARRASVTAAVKVVKVTVVDGQSFRVHTFFDHPPVPLRFNVWVRAAGGQREFRVPFLSESATAGSSSAYDGDVKGSLADAKRVDVIFRPDPAGGRDEVDLRPVWGEDVVVHDVPVTRPAR